MSPMVLYLNTYLGSENWESVVYFQVLGLHQEKENISEQVTGGYLLCNA